MYSSKSARYDEEDIEHLLLLSFYMMLDGALTGLVKSEVVLWQFRYRHPPAADLVVCGKKCIHVR